MRPIICGVSGGATFSKLPSPIVGKVECAAAGQLDAYSIGVSAANIVSLSHSVEVSPSNLPPQVSFVMTAPAVKDLDVNIQYCRGRQQGLLDVMREKNLDLAIVTRHEHVQWLVGPRFLV